MAKEQTARDAQGPPPQDDGLCCARCGHRVTSRAYRRDLAGGHQHTFVNPAGHVFEIGCFAAAPGARVDGPASAEFSWFPGWLWRVAACGGCGGHLGWRFELGAERVFGLITAALR